MRLSSRVKIVVLALTLVSIGAWAGPPKAELKTERVIVFKDGYCLVVQRVSGTTDDSGLLITDQVPDAAVLGSVWAMPEEGRLLSMSAEVVTETESSTEPRLCTSHVELLQVNLGRSCVVVLEDGTRLEGRILKVLAGDEPEPHAPQQLSTRPAPLPASVVTRSVLSASLFVLRTEDGDVALSTTDIRRLMVDDMTVDCEQRLSRTTSGKRLSFRFDKGRAERELMMFYFTPGLRWIPTYRVELDAEERLEKRARFTLQAEILNEIEDLEDVMVSVVVGVPNFRFREVISPLALEATLRNALNQAAPQLSGQTGQLSNVLHSQRVSEWRSSAVADRERTITVDLPEELTGASSQDLFVYDLGRLSLAKGARTAVPIFDAEIPYRDVYTWDLTLKRKDIEFAPSGAGVPSPLALSGARVWHQVELVNSTDHPWTTGACMIMAGQQPLAQELLTYTSPGARVRVPVTVAVDLRGSFDEEETGRTLEALRWDGRTYARIDKTGTLSLANAKSLPVSAEITCHLGGRATEASDGGRIVLDAFRQDDWDAYRGHQAVNNHSAVSWQQRIDAGATFQVTVAYHYFVRQ
jgi:hypothetical protein